MLDVERLWEEDVSWESLVRLTAGNVYERIRRHVSKPLCFYNYGVKTMAEKHV